MKSQRIQLDRWIQLDKYIDAAATPWDDFDPQASVSTPATLRGFLKQELGGTLLPIRTGDCLKKHLCEGIPKSQMTDVAIGLHCIIYIYIELYIIAISRLRTV